MNAIDAAVLRTSRIEAFGRYRCHQWCIPKTRSSYTCKLVSDRTLVSHRFCKMRHSDLLWYRRWFAGSEFDTEEPW